MTQRTRSFARQQKKTAEEAKEAAEIVQAVPPKSKEKALPTKSAKNKR